MTGALIGLARATDGGAQLAESTWKVMIEGLFTTVTNVNFDEHTICELIKRVHAEKDALVPMCSGCGSPCVRTMTMICLCFGMLMKIFASLKSLILFGYSAVSQRMLIMRWYWATQMRN